MRPAAERSGHRGAFIRAGSVGHLDGWDLRLERKVTQKTGDWDHVQQVFHHAGLSGVHAPTTNLWLRIDTNHHVAGISPADRTIYIEDVGVVPTRRSHQEE